MTVRIARRGSMAGRGAAALVNTWSNSASAGNYASTPDTATNSIIGDIDVRVLFLPGATAPGADGEWALMSKWPGTSNRAWHLGLQGSAGSVRLWFYVSTTGTDNPNTSSSILTLSTTVATWVRATRVASSGAVAFYTSTDGTDWTAQGTGSTTAGNIFDSSSAVTVSGYHTSFTSSPVRGNVYKAELRNGIGGTLVNIFDPTAVTKIGTRNPTTAVGSTGETWTCAGSAWDWVSV